MGVKKTAPARGKWAAFDRPNRRVILGEQLGPGGGEFHVSSGIVPPQPAQCDRASEGAAELVRSATLPEEGAVDQPIKMRLSWTASTALAICTSLRAAASGSVKWLDSTNFMSRGYHDRRHRQPSRAGISNLPRSSTALAVRRLDCHARRKIRHFGPVIRLDSVCRHISG
jgi:hypothetical protein